MAAVVLPLLGLLAELSLRMFVGLVGDPFPSPVFVAACLVAAACAAWAFAVARLPSTGTRSAPVALGFFVGLTAFYALWFVPAIPLMMLGSIIGLGLLAAAPYWGLLGAMNLHDALLSRWRARHGEAREYWLRFSAGAGLFALLLVAEETRLATVEFNVARASSPDRRVAAESLQTVRSLAFENELLDRCRGRRRFLVAEGDWLRGACRALLRGCGLPVLESTASTQVYRDVFFRVTGRPHDAFPPVRMIGFAERRDGRPVSLSGSRFAARVEPAAALAYLTWTMELSNRANNAREARAVIRVPEEACASHLTLWIGGEERIAAFAPRAQATEAYMEIARRQRKDPALLRAVGADRYELLVFPVPRRGTQQVRVGLTVPLRRTAASSVLQLPCFEETSFRVAAGMRHTVDAVVVNQAPLAHEGMRLDPSSGGTAAGGRRWTIRGDGVAGTLTSDELVDPAARSISFPLPASPGKVWAEDGKGVCLQTWELRPPDPWRGPLVVVIDGSGAVGDVPIHWERLFDGWSSSTPCTVLFAGVGTEEYTGRLGDARLRTWLADRSFGGGIDPVPALTAARTRAGVDGRVLWLHGPQEQMLGSLEGLRGSWSRRGGPDVLAFPVVTGPNVVLDALRGFADVHPVARWGRVRGDMRRLAGRDGKVGRVLTRLPGDGSEEQAGAVRVSEHLCRLWAARECGRLAAVAAANSVESSEHTAAVTAATDLAVRYRLVTPHTAAVVLETEEQYDRHDLDPHAEADVGLPSTGGPVPELETWLMLVAGLLLVVVVRRRWA